MRNTVALVLFLDGFERECMRLMGRMAQLPAPVPTLLVGGQQHRAIVPVLLESGASHVLFDVPDDIKIADWICRLPAVQPRAPHLR